MNPLTGLQGGAAASADPLEAPHPAFSAADAARVATEVFGITGDLTPLHGERDLNFRIADPAGRSC